MFNYPLFCSLYLTAGDFDDFDSFLATQSSKSPFDDKEKTERLLRLVWEYSCVRNIKTLRRATGLSQKDFAKKYGCKYRTVQNWETGYYAPAEYILHWLAFAVISDVLAAYNRIMCSGNT